MSQNPLAIRGISTYSAAGTREAQEDAVLVVREKGIFVVADGFGGPVPGGTASRSSCEAIRGFLVKEAGDLEATLPFVLRSYFSLAGNVLFNALIHANRKLTKSNRGKNVHDRGGASVLAGYMDGEFLALASVGGCSAWLMRGDSSIELVIPRTYGRLRDPLAARARIGSAADAPLMALGIAEDLEPEIFEYRVCAGDWVLFTTDGLDPEALQALMDLKRSGKTPEKAASEATRLLGLRKYADNIAAALVIF